MKKYILIVILAIVLEIICICMIYEKFEYKIIEEEIKPKIEELSQDEKDNLNYKHLLEDIKAIKNDKEIIHAKEIKSSIYYGEGYIIKDMILDDAFETTVLSSKDSKVIYDKITSAWGNDNMFEHIEENLKRNLLIEIIIVVVIADLGWCFVIYKKNKKYFRKKN